MSAPEAPRPLSVSQVNARIKALLEGQEAFRGMTVEAELGGVTYHRSGHLYLTLKDAQSELSGVMYRSQVEKNRYGPFATGDRVLATGNLTVYEPRGQYQLLLTRLVPVGEGVLYAQLQRLKSTLEAEGLFDAARKRPLPRFPRRVALITSETGAVRHDIETTLRRRGARLHVTLIPATVQGETAVPSLQRALAAAVAVPGAEVVVVARGGGSLEDLWSFNDAAWVRAFANCPLPTISAIGHETDVTLTDLAADLRAPTPTAAAELLAPSETELLGELAYHRETQRQALRYSLDRAWEQASNARTRLQAVALATLTQQQNALHLLAQRHQSAFQQHLARQHAMLETLAATLAAHNPQALVAKGFAYAQAHGKPLTHRSQVAPGQRIQLYVVDGKLEAEVLTASNLENES